MIVNFYFHSIGETALSFPVKKFELFLVRLKKKRFNSITLNQIHESDPEKNYVVLTFDDCFYDVYENALSLLLKHNFKGTFFAVPGYDGVVRWGSEKYQKWSDYQSEDFNIPYRYMGEIERKKLLEYGMEIGAHTFGHPNLDALNIEEQRLEIQVSKAILEKELNYSIDSFCYPRGRYNEITINLLKNVGFKRACTTKKGYVDVNGDPFQIKRFAAPYSKFVLDSILLGKSGDRSFLDKVLDRLNRLIF
jgi:peptidoglycan/xylan/chitin deacetylase (PgdA/CDA1 family)